MRRTSTALLVFVLGIGSWFAVEAQTHRGMMPADETVITVTAPDGVPEIPFELRNNHLILPVSVNGSAPLDVVLDTGMPATGIALYGDESTADIGLDFDPAMNAMVGGAGGHGKRFTARIAPSESLSLPGVEIRQTRVLELPAMPGLASYHDGIIGLSLFERFVVEIDYDARVLRLHEPANYQTPAGARVLPLTFRQNIPYAQLSVNAGRGSVEDVEVVVDLGASHAISLNSGVSNLLVAPDEAVETALGHGLSGPILGRVGRIESLKLGDSILENVVASFPEPAHQNPRGVDSLAGNLGSEVLRRFQTTFDYSRQRMLLVPNRAFGEPFLFDRSGVRLSLGGELLVEEVMSDSPAAKAGVEVGDLLTHLNGEPVSREDFLRVRAELKKSGDVRLTLLRSEQRFEVSFTLRPLV